MAYISHFLLLIIENKINLILSFPHIVHKQRF